MKYIKIIDLLKRVSKGKKVPKKIRYDLMSKDYKIILYNEEEEYFYFENFPEEEWFPATHHLNDKVEILK